MVLHMSNGILVFNIIGGALMILFSKFLGVWLTKKTYKLYGKEPPKEGNHGVATFNFIWIGSAILIGSAIELATRV